MNGTRAVVSSLPLDLAGVNGPWATRVFSAVSGYHLMDVLALLGDEYPSPPVVQRAPIVECKLPVSFEFDLVYLHINCSGKFYSHLGDWVKLVADLDATLKKEKDFTDTSRAPGAVHIQLMHHLSRFGASHKRHKITMNWLAAAAHLAFLNSRQCNGSLSELPESATALADLYTIFILFLISCQS